MDKKVIFIGLVAILIFGAILLNFSNEKKIVIKAGDKVLVGSNLGDVLVETESDWKKIELVDILTSETYTIEKFMNEGKPVLIESFAVWCSTCTNQQIESNKYHEESGDDIISIGLNIDSNEDEEKIMAHAIKNGFSLKYSISPEVMTLLLVAEYGTDILSAPDVPMILVCPNGTSRLLGSGIKKVFELKKEVATCN